MPELPEVETISKDLNKEISGKTIKRVLVAKGYKTFPEPEAFIRTLVSTRIEGVTRIAKVIIVSLENKVEALTFHLAMTGRVLFHNSRKGKVVNNHFEEVSQKEKHIKVALEFDDLSLLTFSDVRMFGYAKVINLEEAEKLKKKYGPTPFHKDLSPEKLLEILTSRKTQIKRALLEQDLVSGLGNIYANDSLWLANIHPERITHSLTIVEAGKLLEAMKTILAEGIEHRGSTLDDKMYVDIYGNEGHHQNYFRVYGKAQKPCPRCGVSIKSIVVAQRSTFYCPSCQV